MKSFEKIAEAMYRKWQAALIRFRKPMPFYQLEAHEQQAWIAAAQAAKPLADAQDTTLKNHIKSLMCVEVARTENLEHVSRAHDAAVLHLRAAIAAAKGEQQ